MLVGDILTTSILGPLIDELKDTMLSTLLSTFKELFPVFLIYLSVVILFKFIKQLFTPKYDGIIFDDNYSNDFDLAYDSLRDMYDSEDDFINDYMSDFTAFQNEPELDELVEYDIWDNISDDYYDYYDPQSEFIYEYQFDFEFSYDEFDGSFTDYVEHSESE